MGMMIMTKDSLKLLQLREGQMRTGDSTVHNGGWYNTCGDKIGWGDGFVKQNLPRGEAEKLLAKGQ